MRYGTVCTVMVAQGGVATSWNEATFVSLRLVWFHSWLDKLTERNQQRIVRPVEGLNQMFPKTVTPCYSPYTPISGANHLR